MRSVFKSCSIFQQAFSLLAIGTFYSESVMATTTINVNSDSGSYQYGSQVSLVGALWNVPQTSSSSNPTIIDCSSIAGHTINLTQPLPAIVYPYVTVVGGLGVTVNGTSTGPNTGFQAFSIVAPNVRIENFTVENAISQGGSGGGGGGGGGAGGGGAFYVENGASVTLSQVSMNGCVAVGGDGGSVIFRRIIPPVGEIGGGGGGFGGGSGGNSSNPQTSSSCGGGGGGHPGGGIGNGDETGGNSFSYSYGGAGGGGDHGTNSSLVTFSGGSSTSNYQGASGYLGGGGSGVGSGGGGGAYGKGGNGGIQDGGTGGKGIGVSDFGGGGGGSSSEGLGGSGEGAGGGGGSFSKGGLGGPSGGGGGGGYDLGGNGGFGGGGGGSYNGKSSTSLALGGSGGVGGGGGAGLGGAIFIQKGGALTIEDSISFSGNSMVAGKGYTEVHNGSSLGPNIFMRSGGFLFFEGTMTFSSGITGSVTDKGSGGGVTIKSGTVTLGGNNTYTGGTTIDSGATLMIPQGSSLPESNSVTDPGVPDVTNNGSLIFDSSNPFTYSGNISGTGSFTQQGTNNLTLTGVNTYTRGTNVTGGVLSIQGSSQIGSGPVSIFNNAALGIGVKSQVPIDAVFSNDINIGASGGTLYYSISDSGSHKVSGSLTAGNLAGSGLLTFSGSSLANLIFDVGSNGTSTGSSFTGGFTLVGTDTYITLNPGYQIGSSGSPAGAVINNGIVALQGDSALYCTSFVNNYYLIGCGNVHLPTGVSIQNNGRMNTGCSTSFFTIEGGLISASGSVISPYLDSESIAALDVSENVVLEEGVSLILRPLLDCYKPVQHYEFLTTGGTLTGTFATVEAGTYFLTPSITYLSNGVDITLTKVGFGDIVQGGNASSIAAVLDAVSESASTCEIIKKVFYETPEGISSALDSMQPSLFKGLTLSQENNAVKVLDTLSARMQDVLNQKHCYKEKDCTLDEKTVHVWASGFGDILHQKSIFYAGSPQVGYQTKTGGATLGLDGHFAKYFYAGALGGYTDSDVHFMEHRGKGTISTGYGGLYFSALSDLFYTNLAVIGGWSHFTGKRNILFPEETFVAKNEHGGSQLLSHLDAGVNLGWKGITFRPFDSFDYVVQTEQGFTESGAANLNLKVKKSNAILLRNELGAQFAGCFCMGSSKWTVSPKISWVREVRVKGSTYTSEFIEETIPFTVTGFFPDRSLISPGVMVSGVMMNDLLSLDLYYDGEFGEKFNDHNYGGQIRFAF